MSSLTIDHLWRRYARVLPVNASALQIRETRRAFYAGAAALIGGLMRVLEAGSEPTEEDLNLMTSLNDELEAFFKHVKEGVS